MIISQEKHVPPLLDNVIEEKYVIKVKGLSINFPTSRGIYTSVRDLDLKVKPGKILAIVGESGSGKSVTGKALLGLIEPPGVLAGGAVMIGKENIFSQTDERKRSLRGKQVGMIFQDPGAAFDPVFTIGAQMTESILAHNLGDKKEAKNISLKWLNLVGFIEPQRIFNCYPFELSGGMRQRAYIAMVMSLNPKILIADEPTTALDMITQARILSLLKKIQLDTGCSIVFITHDLGIVANFADEVLVMYGGQGVEQGPVEDVLYQPSHPYTEALINSIKWGSKKGRLRPIPGQPPEMHKLPSGCAFNPRCSYAMIKCQKEVPSLRTLTDGTLCRCHRPIIYQSSQVAGEGV